MVLVQSQSPQIHSTMSPSCFQRCRDVSKLTRGPVSAIHNLALEPAVNTLSDVIVAVQVGF